MSCTAVRSRTLRRSISVNDGGYIHAYSRSRILPPRSRYSLLIDTRMGTVLELMLFENLLIGTDRARKSFVRTDRWGGAPPPICQQRGIDPWGHPTSNLKSQSARIRSAKSFRNGNLENRYRHPTPGLRCTDHGARCTPYGLGGFFRTGLSVVPVLTGGGAVGFQVELFCGAVGLTPKSQT